MPMRATRAQSVILDMRFLYFAYRSLAKCSLRCNAQKFILKPIFPVQEYSSYCNRRLRPAPG